VFETESGLAGDFDKLNAGIGRRRKEGRRMKDEEQDEEKDEG